MSDRRKLSRDKSRKFLEHIAVFSPGVLGDFLDRVLGVEVRVDEESKLMELYFIVDVEKKPLSGEMIDACVMFRGSEYAKCVRLVVEGYEWDEGGVMAVISAFVGGETLRISLEEKRVTLHGQDMSKIYDHVNLIRRALSFIFRDQVDLHLNQEPKVSEVKKKSESSFSRSSFGGQEGEYCCFKLEEKVDHAGNRKYKVGFSDLTNFYWFSIANRKGSEAEADELFGKLRVNGWYRIRFSLNTSDRFADSLDGFLNGAEPLDRADGLGKVLRKDECEFGGYAPAICTHTKNSAFDGLYEVEEIVEEAANRGHGAVGLTDAGSVQSFAAFEKAVKKRGLKGLYGVELEIIPDRVPILIGGYESRWLEEGIRIGGKLCDGWDGVSYCVFDIETTGLYPCSDEIIQIAVKKYCCGNGGGKYIDFDGINEVATFDRYIKIKGRLSDKIVSLTNITREKLERCGGDAKEVLGEFREFVKGSLLVAHNGIDFDVPFINAHLRRHGFKELEETLIDTLNLSRYLFLEKNYKSHSLSALAKKSSIPYEENEAHNALYDVDILANLFFRVLWPDVVERIGSGIDRIATINEYFWERKKEYRYGWGDEVLVYIKHQEGVKDLYELVSLAHTKYYSDGVKLVRSELNGERRKNLIIVSNPFPGDRSVLGAVLKDDREMFRNMAQWFDYVTIPPLDHLRHIKSKDELGDGDIRAIIAKFVEWCEEDGVR